MANNEKNKSEITAKDLFSKLGKENNKRNSDDSAFFDKLSSIDVTSDNSADSDSDLDISELLKKYLPEFSNAEESAFTSEMKDINGEINIGKVLDTIEAESVNEVASNAEEYINQNITPDSVDDIIDDNNFTDASSDVTSSDNEIIETAPEVETPTNEIQFADGVFTEYEIDNDGSSMPIASNNSHKDETEMSETEKTMNFLDNLLGKSAKAANDEQYTETENIAENEAGSNEEPKDEIGLSNDLFTQEENVNISEENKENTDPTDINLMIAFDIDSEDEETAAKAKEIGDKFEDKSKKKKKKFVLDRPEYVDKSQTSEIRTYLNKKKTSLTIRTVIACVFSLFLMIYENFPAISRLFTGSAKQFAGALDPALYPVVYIMISLQLMLFVALCALPEIIYGCKSLFIGILRPESITFILTVSGILYSGILCNVIKAPQEPVMLNFSISLSIVLTLFASILNIKREIMNFRIVSNKKAKHVVRKMLEEESHVESEAFSETEEICDVMKIEKTDFIENFLTRLATPDHTVNSTLTFLVSAAAAAAVIIGILSSLQSENTGSTVLQTIFSAFYILSPVSVFLAFCYPFYRANKAASEYDSAIIGETSLNEYSNASIISFDDKSVFPSYSVKVQNIRIYNNARIDRVLYYASSVFAYAGGPLQDVFEIATKDMGNSDNVQIFDTEAGFLATQVDGVNIIFGNFEALTSRGLEIPAEAAQDDVDLSDELSIMYMFRESKLVAKMYIKYDMDEDIDVILKQFAGEGLFVCVRTFDPNIDEIMISKKLAMKRAPLKVIRYSNPDEVGKYEEKVDSGLVTCSSPKSLLQVISYCEKVLHTKKTNIAISVLSMMIGAVIMLLLMLAGSLNLVTSLVISLYQLAWIIPTIIATRIFIR